MIWRFDTIHCQGRTFLVTVKEVTPDKKFLDSLQREWKKIISVFPQNGPAQARKLKGSEKT